MILRKRSVEDDQAAVGDVERALGQVLDLSHSNSKTFQDLNQVHARDNRPSVRAVTLFGHLRKPRQGHRSPLSVLTPSTLERI